MDFQLPDEYQEGEAPVTPEPENFPLINYAYGIAECYTAAGQKVELPDLIMAYNVLVMLYFGDDALDG